MNRRSVDVAASTLPNLKCPRCGHGAEGATIRKYAVTDHAGASAFIVMCLGCLADVRGRGLRARAARETHPSHQADMREPRVDKGDDMSKSYVPVTP